MRSQTPDEVARRPWSFLLRPALGGRLGEDSLIGAASSVEEQRPL